MTYQEKRAVFSILLNLIYTSVYCLYAYGKYQMGVVDASAWARFILIYLGIGIVVMIVFQILFHIFVAVTVAAKETISNGKCEEKDIEKLINSEMTTDELDNLIELKTSKMGFVLCGVGFVSGLAALAVNASVALMLNILFLSFLLGALLEECGKLVYYRKGF